MSAVAVRSRIVHLRVQLFDRTGLVFLMTEEQYRAIEEQFFELMLGPARGEIELPLPDDCRLPVEVSEILSFERFEERPAGTPCLS